MNEEGIETLYHKHLPHLVRIVEKSTTWKDRTTGEIGPATELELGTYVRSIAEFQPRAIGPSRHPALPITL